MKMYGLGYHGVLFGFDPKMCGLFRTVEDAETAIGILSQHCHNGCEKQFYIVEVEVGV